MINSEKVMNNSYVSNVYVTRRGHAKIHNEIRVKIKQAVAISAQHAHNLKLLSIDVSTQFYSVHPLNTAE